VQWKYLTRLGFQKSPIRSTLMHILLVTPRWETENYTSANFEIAELNFHYTHLLNVTTELPPVMCPVPLLWGAFVGLFLQIKVQVPKLKYEIPLSRRCFCQILESQAPCTNVKSPFEDFWRRFRMRMSHVCRVTSLSSRVTAWSSQSPVKRTVKSLRVVGFQAPVNIQSNEV